MGYKCPKCGYERQPGDLAPEYESPKCGVIYEKVKKPVDPGEEHSEAENVKSENNEPNKITSHHDD